MSVCDRCGYPYGELTAHHCTLWNYDQKTTTNSINIKIKYLPDSTAIKIIEHDVNIRRKVFSEVLYYLNEAGEKLSKDAKDWLISKIEDNK